MSNEDPTAGLDYHLEDRCGVNDKPDPEYDCQGDGGPECRCHACIEYKVYLAEIERDIWEETERMKP